MLGFGLEPLLSFLPPVPHVSEELFILQIMFSEDCQTCDAHGSAAIQSGFDFWLCQLQVTLMNDYLVPPFLHM